MTDQGNDGFQAPPSQRLGRALPRRLLVILLLAAGTYLLIPRLAGTADTLKLLKEADGLWLLAALTCQVGTLLLGAYVVHQAIPAFGSPIPFAKVLQVSLASSFVTMIIPSAGLSGLALRVKYFRERDCPPEGTLFTYWLELAGHGVAIIVTVGLALLSMAVRGESAPWWILLPVAGTVLGGAAALAMVLAKPRDNDWRWGMVRRVNSVLTRLGRPTHSVPAVRERLENVRQVVLGLPPALRMRLLLASLARIFADILCAQMTLLAFGQGMMLRLVMIAYGLSSVFAYVSSSPGGLLVTEGSMAAVLANYGVPISAAISATLTYRLFAFWLPRLLGLGTWLHLERQSRNPMW